MATKIEIIENGTKLEVNCYWDKDDGFKMPATFEFHGETIALQTDNLFHVALQNDIMRILEKEKEEKRLFLLEEEKLGLFSDEEWKKIYGFK